MKQRNKIFIVFHQINDFKFNSMWNKDAFGNRR